MSTVNKKSGFLEVIFGPMFSGKTTALLEIYKQCIFCNIPVSIINHASDTRYHDTLVSTHDKITAPCIQSSKLGDVWFPNEQMEPKDGYVYNSHCSLRHADVILINEGQFFTDLYDVVVDMLKHKKKIYVGGLDGDFERKKFGQILDLIPICDNVRKITSLCSLCKDGTRGIFSMRLTSETEQTVVGSDNYIPVCRDCYDNNYSEEH